MAVEGECYATEETRMVHRDEEMNPQIPLCDAE
jgi:hypothetical protein